MKNTMYLGMFNFPLFFKLLSQLHIYYRAGLIILGFIISEENVRKYGRNYERVFQHGGQRIIAYIIRRFSSNVFVRKNKLYKL